MIDGLGNMKLTAKEEEVLRCRIRVDCLKLKVAI